MDFERGGFVNIAVKESISRGSLVALKSDNPDPDAATLLKRWIAAYGRGPFIVVGMLDNEHVTLAHPRDPSKSINFGSTTDPSLNIGFVELWED